MPILRSRFSLFQLLILVVVVAAFLPLVAWKLNQWLNPRPNYLNDGVMFHKGDVQFTALWLMDDSKKLLGGIAVIGTDRPQIFISNRGHVRIDTYTIPVPLDGKIHLLDSNLQLHQTNVPIERVAEKTVDWVSELEIDVKKYSWDNQTNVDDAREE